MNKAKQNVIKECLTKGIQGRASYYYAISINENNEEIIIKTHLAGSFKTEIYATAEEVKQVKCNI